jgi:hypothetical protein
MRPDIWYPNGYKFVTYHPRSGKQIEGTYLKVESAEKYFNFDLEFFDVLPYAGKPIGFLLTPTLMNTSGSITSDDGMYTISYKFTDIGKTGECPITVTQVNTPSNLQVFLVDKNNYSLNLFGKSAGSKSYTAICADLLDSTIQVLEKTTSLTTLSKVVGKLDLSGMNGHNIEIKVAYIQK